VKAFVVLITAALGATGAALSPPQPQGDTEHAPQLRQITVDASSLNGSLRSFQGVNGAPAPHVHKPEDFRFGGWAMSPETDTSKGYRQARIDVVRTHDSYGPGDIDAIFGADYGPPGAVISAERGRLSIFPDPTADPAQASSYNFRPTDELITSIKRVGAQVIFRLGRSESSAVEPPRDMDRYAEVVRHIVLHYNRGWAKGFHYGIRYWEVWNEPDLARMFWGGTAANYFALYGKLARAVKAADPAALVGGPALARPNDATPYLDDFLDYVRSEHLPLDFYSWHWYATDSDDPLDIVRVGRDVRARLDRHGFTRTRSIVDEWNYGLIEPWPSDLQRASFIASTLIYMQDAPIDLAALYRADNVFGKDGATPDKTGQALIALGRMKDTPARLTVEGADLDGFGVQAGRSKNGRTLQILISNYQIPAEFIGPRKTPDILRVGSAFAVTLLKRRSVTYRRNAGYDLTINHLAPRGTYVVERYRISASSDFALVDQAIYRGEQIRLQASLPPPGIELVIVKLSARRH
jgi:xylan 1,4-beta-xylosidase